MLVLDTRALEEAVSQNTLEMLSWDWGYSSTNFMARKAQWPHPVLLQQRRSSCSKSKLHIPLMVRARPIVKHFVIRLRTDTKGWLTHSRTGGACFARSSILFEGLLLFVIWPGGGLVISTFVALGNFSVR